MGHPAIELSHQAVEQIEPALTRGGFLVALLDESDEEKGDTIVAYTCRSQSGASLIVRVRQPRQFKDRAVAVIMPDPDSKNRGFFAESKHTLKLQSILGRLANE